MPPPSKLSLEFKGLVTSPGQLAIPTGALTVCENINFPAPGVAEKRYGFAKAAFGFGSGAHAFVSTPQLGSKVLVNRGILAGATALGLTDGTAAITGVSMPDGTNVSNTVTNRMKVAVMSRSHYVTSTRATAVVPPVLPGRFAGMPRPPGVDYNATPLVTAVAGGVLAANYACAYRVTWTLTETDASGTITQEITSAPSGRYVVANISGTGGWAAATARDIQLNVMVPTQADTISAAINANYWTMRVYRSPSIDFSLGTPSDELQLCYEARPTAGQITAGVVTFTDSAPNAALGAYLYTNQNNGGDVGTTLVRSTTATEGIATSNDRPPVCTDVAAFQNCLFYANLQTLWRKTFSILAVGTAGTVLKAGDTVSIQYAGPVTATLTAVSGAPGANQFKVETGYTTLTDNVRQTAMNLVAAINSSSVRTTLGSLAVVATYIGNDAAPGAIGKIMVEAIRSDVSLQGGIYTTAGAAGFIGLNDPSFTRDVWPNGIAISKPLLGDAVPPCNYLRVGRADAQILRVVTLRDALYVFTEDGIWWIRGQDPSNFQVDQFDNSFRLLARDSLVVCADAIYAWGREGIIRLTNGGVEYIDLPIRDLTTEAVQALGETVFTTNAWSVAYRVQRRVLFFYRTAAATNTYGCDKALVWNIATQTWSQYDFRGEAEATGDAKMCGAVRDSDGTMLMGAASDGADTPIWYETTAATTTWEDYRFDNDKTVPTQVLMTWATTAPVPDGICRWHECQIYFSPDTTASFVGVPGATVLTLQTELVSNPNAPAVAQYQSTIFNPLSMYERQVVRIMCEPSVSFAARMNVGLINGTTTPFRLSAWAMLYSPVSNFMVR
jgi:hypothetical protein